MKQALLTLTATLLLLPGSAVAADRWPGWTYENGYWYYGGEAYYEQAYQEPYTYVSYYSYGYPVYAIAYRTKYRYVKAAVPSYQGSLQALLKMAEQRNKAEIKVRAQAAEVELLGRAADVLGMRGNFNYGAFGLNPYLATYNSSLSQSYGTPAATSLGQQGQTLYQTRQATDAYGVKLLDLDASMAMAQRLVQGGLDYTREANQGFQGIVREGGVAAGRIAEIQARGQAAATALRATEPQPASQTRTTTTVIGSNTLPAPAPASVPSGVDGSFNPPRVMPPAGDGNDGGGEIDQASWMQLSGPAKCVSCHGQGGKDQKHFDLTKYHPRRANREEVARVFLYINDPAGCPKDKSQRLTAEEQLQLIK